jgi:hypothetical protein
MFTVYAQGLSGLWAQKHAAAQNEKKHTEELGLVLSTYIYITRLGNASMCVCTVNHYAASADIVVVTKYIYPKVVFVRYAATHVK